MQTLRLEQAYPGDSLKVMWRDSGRAARDQTQGSPGTPCPRAAPSLSSHLSLGVNTGGQLSAHRCRKDFSTQR